MSRMTRTSERKVGWEVTIVYAKGPPSTLRFDELDKALMFVEDACKWMEIAKSVKVSIERVTE